MPKFAGIDPGTSEFEIFVLEDEKPKDRINVKTDLLRKSPERFLEILEKISADLITGLSGYGMPIKKFSELSERDILLLTLNLDQDSAMGLRNLINLSIDRNLNIYTIPGVIHLPTVPEHRKINRIDLGTADKLCSAVLGVYELSFEEDLSKIDFILLESGYGFNSAISVKNGKIVDGVGGSCSFPAFSSIGFFDGELAYLTKTFPKRILFSGGVRDYLKAKGKNVSRIDDLNEQEMIYLSENLLKNLMVAKVSNNSENVLLSGGNFNSKRFLKIFIEKAEKFDFNCRVLRGFGKAKQSAEGAGIIANGIAGGELRDIVDHMEIRKSRGTVLDYITGEIREYLRIEM